MSADVEFKMKKVAKVTIEEGTTSLKELRDALDDLLNPDPGEYGIAHDTGVHIQARLPLPSQTWTPEMIVLVFEEEGP